jgi:hypothetical protein
MYLHPRHKLGMNEKRKSYPSDVSDEEWAFCVSSLTLMREQAPQRLYPLREIFNALLVPKTKHEETMMNHENCFTFGCCSSL